MKSEKDRQLKMMKYSPVCVRKWLITGLLALLLVQGSELAKGQPLENISWSQMNGPVGGNATSLLLATDGSLFVGTFRGGVFRSMDGGQSWTNVGVQHTFNIEGLVESPRGTLIAGTGDGIHRSTDGGHTWSLVEETIVPGMGPQLSATIAVDPNGWILSGSRIGLYRSKDDGLSWEQVPGIPRVGEIETAPSGQTFLIGADRIYRFDVEEDAWVEISTSVEGQPYWRSLAVLDSSTIIASRSDYQNDLRGVLRTTDGGQTWEETALKEFIDYLDVDAAGRVFAGDEESLFRSSDQGETWEQLDLPLPGFWLTMLATYGEDNIIVGLRNAGLFQSNDAGESWQPINTGFINSNVFTSVVDAHGHIFAGTARRVWRSLDGGTSWDDYGLNGTSDVNRLLITPSGSLLARVREGTLVRLYRSSSEIANWQAIDTFAPQDLAMGPAGHIFGLEYDLSEEKADLWRSTDDGETWQHIAEVPAARTLMVHLNGYIFLGTREFLYPSRGIYRSSDNGQTWVQLTSGLTSTRNPNGLPDITFFIVDEAGQIFAGTFGDGIFLSTDEGDTWQATSADAEFIETMILNDGKLFVGTRSQGVFVTEDGGDTWMSVNDNLGNYWVTSLSVDDDGHLVAGTEGNGVFRTINPISVSVAAPPPDVSANEPVLQCYPNPFRTVTTLAFTLPAAMPVRLAVHDIMGREVAILLDEYRVGGYQTTTFHGNGLPSGIYMVTLSTPQGDLHEKVLLVK